VPVLSGSVTVPSIWLVEDDQSIGSALARTFEAEGYATTWVGSVAEARGLRGQPDLVVLDRGLPDGDGLDLCRELRASRPNVRVLMLTARTDEIDVVLGLDAGAVDYVVKPFRLAELLARVRAQLRDGGEGSVSDVDLGGIVVDRAARRVWVRGSEVPLRPKEFDLLARLADDAGNVVRREALMADVWDSHWFGGTKTLDVHIAAVRRHIDDPDGPSRITTVRGVGYRLEPGP